jgi:hypothetical protein
MHSPCGTYAEQKAFVAVLAVKNGSAL